MLILTQCRRTHTNPSLYQLRESKLNGKMTQKDEPWCGCLSKRSIHAFESSISIGD